MAKAATVTKEVATIDETRKAVSTPMPDFMAQYAGMGTENIGADDIETARVKLLQGLSPEVEEFEEARVGQFWHTIAQTALGSQVPIVPIYIDKMAILWRPQDDGGGILARSTDLMTWDPPTGEFKVKINKGTKQVTWKLVKSVAASRLLDWGSSDPDDASSQPAATKMINIVCAFPTFPGLPPAVVTLQRTSIRASKKLLGQLSLVKAPSFGCRFMMSAVDDQNSNGQKFKNFSFAPIGMVQDQDEFQQYLELHQQYKRLGLKIKDIDGLAEEDVAQDEGVATDPSRPSY